MIYPCTGCLVDVICIDACDEFIWYMDEIKTVIPHMIVDTSIRFKRAGKSATMYQRSVRLYDYLGKARDLVVNNRLYGYDTRFFNY